MGAPNQRDNSGAVLFIFTDATIVHCKLSHSELLMQICPVYVGVVLKRAAGFCLLCQ